MNIKMSSQIFKDVEIPLLWGKRAIMEDKEGKMYIIALDGEKAIVEVIANEPAPNIEYELVENGFKIILNGNDVYSFDPNKKIITSISLNLPECELNVSHTRIGSNIISGCSVSGFGVGIVVNEQGMSIGAPLPEGLATLIV